MGTFPLINILCPSQFSTAIMSDRWTVLSLDTNTWYDAGGLNAFFWGRQAQNIVYLFAKPNETLRRTLSIQTQHHHAALQSHSPCLQLPPEILLGIFDELDLRTCLRLTTTCRQLWYVGMDFLDHLKRNWWAHESWAGSRMILLPQDCGPKEYPNDLLTDAEGILLEEGLDECELDRAVDRGDLHEDHLLTTGPCSLLDLFRIAYRRVEHKAPRLSCLFNERDISHLPHMERGVLIDLLTRPLSEYFASTEVWTLRNLSMKEFVRGDSLHSAFQRGLCPAGPDIGYPGFAEAMLCRVCWSSKDSTDIPGMRCPGPWAGHRFEICSHSDHLVLSDPGWKDVSLDVTTDLSQILQMKLKNSHKS